MKYLRSTIILLIVITTACSKKEVDPFLVSKNNIGFLNDSTQVKDLESIYINDSIVRFKPSANTFGNINDIDIFEKGGNHLLTLTAKQVLDSTSIIKVVRVLDPRFKTEKGITIESTFKDIKDNYNISSIDKTFRTMIISVNEINAFFNISKDNLPADMWFNTKDKVDVLQVPDDVKINAFFVQWPEK